MKRKVLGGPAISLLASGSQAFSKRRAWYSPFSWHQQVTGSSPPLTSFTVWLCSVSTMKTWRRLSSFKSAANKSPSKAISMKRSLPGSTVPAWSQLVRQMCTKSSLQHCGKVSSNTPALRVNSGGLEQPSTTFKRTPSRPSFPGAPGGPCTPGMPWPPAAPGAPGAPGVPCTPGGPGKPGKPGWPGPPGRPGAPSWPSAPSAPGAPAGPAGPGTPPLICTHCNQSCKVAVLANMRRPWRLLMRAGVLLALAGACVLSSSSAPGR